MRSSILALVSITIISALAGPAPSYMGVEVLEENGQTIVREVVSFLSLYTPSSLLTINIQARTLGKRCTNCVNVGGECTIGEGNCKTSQHAYCTNCGNGRIICVDTDGGSCAAP